MRRKELYSPELLSALKKKNRISKAALCVFICAAVLACIVMCSIQTTLTSRRYELITMAVSTVAGWVAIYWSLDVIAARRKLISHAETLLSGERESFEGECRVLPGSVKIPGSVEIVKVRVGEKTLNLDRSLFKSFGCDGKKVRVESVHGYIVSWEVAE